MSEVAALGIDIGGTRIKAALVGVDGCVLDRQRVSIVPAELGDLAGAIGAARFAALQTSRETVA